MKQGSGAFEDLSLEEARKLYVTASRAESAHIDGRTFIRFRTHEGKVIQITPHKDGTTSATYHNLVEPHEVLWDAFCNPTILKG